MRTLGSRYVLHERLGQGTTGEVWSGEHIPDGEPVAIKVLRPELADDPAIVDRFLREWDLLAGLDSPDLVQVRDLINEPDALAIVMDLVEGIDLRAHLDRSGPRPVSEAVRLVIGVLWALDSVHAAGIVHRDVKPENILIDTSDPQRPFVRLTDFGIARLVHTPGRTSATGPIGTPLYMAPELASGAPPTPAADIYAAGVVLYELLAGSPPFDAAHPADLLRAHREDEPQPIHGVPPVIWDVLSAMLAKSPRERPASAAEAAEELIDALDRLAEDPAYSGGQQRRPEPPPAARRGHGAGPAAGAAFDEQHTQITDLSAIEEWESRSWEREPTGELVVPGGRPSPSTTSTTRLAGMTGPGTAALTGGWNDAEQTQIAGMPPVADGWSDPEATSIAPGMRIPARSSGTAADRNTVISPISSAPQPAAARSSAAARAQADRRRRTRIAAGAGLVVALLAAAGGLALANAGGDDTSLTGDGPAQVTMNPNSTPTPTLPGGVPAVAPSGATPTAVVSGAATARPSASGSASPAPGTDPEPGPSESTPPAGSSPSPSSSPTPTGRAVPDVTGDTVSTAQSTLSGAGFTNVSTTEVCEGSASNNTVVKQSPAAGTTAASTARIVLSVQNCRQVPSVAGSSITAAQNAIRNAGLNPLMGSGGCQWGTESTVASTNPGAGTRMAPGSGVWIEPVCAPSPPPPPPSNGGGGGGSGGGGGGGGSGG